VVTVLFWFLWLLISVFLYGMKPEHKDSEFVTSRVDARCYGAVTMLRRRALPLQKARSKKGSGVKE
jgi:hypothetical protein